MGRTCCLCGGTDSLIRTSQVYEERNAWTKYFQRHIPAQGWICTRHFPKSCLIKQKNRMLLNSPNFMDMICSSVKELPVELPKEALSAEHLMEISMVTSAETSNITCSPQLGLTDEQKMNTSVEHLMETCPSTSTSRHDFQPAVPRPTTSRILNFDLFKHPELKTLFHTIQNNEIFLALPPEWSIQKFDTYIVFFKLKKKLLPFPKIEKSVTLTVDLKVFIYIDGIRRYKQHRVVNKTEELEDIIYKINVSKERKPSKPHFKTYKNKFMYLKRKNSKLESMITNLRKQKFDEQKLQSTIEKLPESQKELINMCFEARNKGKQGVRYTLNWVYSCILLRIKSPKMYRHLRKENLMPLPEYTTILRYLKKIDGSFGFKKQLFDVIREKTKLMPDRETHGTILIDECKITASKHLDRHTMELCGFVDLGAFTPEKQKNQLGDHILVFMFQPFAGNAIQALGCFLSKGNVQGQVQAKLLLECVTLCENAGLHIDLVTSDGATWNRSMWTHFGIQNSSLPWCLHPMETVNEVPDNNGQNRVLRFCSDWPHLVKCLRNLLISRGQFVVPEGIVKHNHFEALLKHEAQNNFKIAHKLSQKHIRPKHYEKMSAKLAFQLFSDSVAIAMRRYKNDVRELADAEPTIQFCIRLNKIIDIMNSSSPLKALKPNSEDFKELETFLLYLDLWKQVSPPQYFLSQSTYDGLKATVSCTLNLIAYLSNELGFQYLMTRRMNQDSLEHFFGMLRSAGGCNTHPESVQVGQIFRLMSIYSLVRPPRGSNVTGGDILKTLLDIQHLPSERKQMEITFQIVVDEQISFETEQFADNKEAFAYLCGYVARHFKKNSCKECQMTLLGSGTESFNYIITQKSRGYLTYPSVDLFNFLKDAEIVISDIFKKELENNSISIIVDRLNGHKFKILLGCTEHAEHLTEEILRYFVIVRLTLQCKKESVKRGSAERSKQLTKQARLC